MPSLIFVRHICDRCGVEVERGANGGEQPALPPRWQHFAVDGDAKLLCAECRDDLDDFLTTPPDPLIRKGAAT